MADASSPRARQPDNRCHLPPGLSASSIRPALEKILNSRGFVHSDRMKRFLQFIVRKTLDGHGGELKEYLVGVEVYDRPETFDPRGDSIVRVEARRLRGKLGNYYQEEGRDARVVVELDKGGYAPRFRMAAPPDRTPKRRDWKIVALAGFVLVSAILMAWAKGCAVVPVSKATGAAFSVLQTARLLLGISP